jgi:AcrR family transcriptional regulator
MQEMQKHAATGLRERKRAKTLARIQNEAMRLFMERGFEHTTLDDIAEAAEVSRRSLFDYFSSKEDIVFSARPDFPKFMAEAVGQRPVKEPLLDMVENAMLDVSASYVSPETRKLACLIRDTPSLSARDQAKYGEVERGLARALADRKSLPETDIGCRVTAAVAIGILKLVLETWLTGKDLGPEQHFKAAFKTLRRIAS